MYIMIILHTRITGKSLQNTRILNPCSKLCSENWHFTNIYNIPEKQTAFGFPDSINLLYICFNSLSLSMRTFYTPRAI